jgi:hypothetical protein
MLARAHLFDPSDFKYDDNRLMLFLSATWGQFLCLNLLQIEWANAGMTRINTIGNFGCGATFLHCANES